MNPTAYLTPQESMFQIASQSVNPVNPEVGEHREIESQNYYVDLLFLKKGENEKVPYRIRTSCRFLLYNPIVP